MKPLNRADRNNAFLVFLLLFVITVGIVITVVFFSINVHFTDNERLKSRLLMLQSEKNISDSFRVAMNITLNEIAKFDLKKDPAIVTKRNVQMKIEKMGRLIKNLPAEKSDERSIYDLVIQNLADLNDAKTRIRNLEDEKVR